MFCYQNTGGLLPRPFTLTETGGLLSVALSVIFLLKEKRPAVSRHHIRRSPDFPLPYRSDYALSIL